jgi:uncharacterized membrane protein
MQHARMTETSLWRGVGSRSVTSAGRIAVHQILMPFPVAYFTAALATDLVYWQTAEVMWERFSVWLITVGLVVAGLAVIATVIDLASGKHQPAWLRVGGYALAVLLSLVNVFIHSRDGYTAVVPTGLILSALAVVILLVMAPARWALTSPRRVGANP